MAGLSSEALMRKFSGLNNTPHSIQTISMWFIHHKKHHVQIVEHWAMEVLKEKRPQKLLTLLYLANDVIQNSRKKFPLYMDEFCKVLVKSLDHIGRHAADPKTIAAIYRVLDIWKERSVYEPEILKKMQTAVRQSTDRAKTPPREIHEKRGSGIPPKSPSPPPVPVKKMKVEVEAEGVAETEVTVASILAQPKKEPEPPTTAQLIAILKCLEKPASADATTRENIAAFPEAVANPSFLKKIANQEQAEELYKIVKQAEPIVTSYCSRLNEEMEERKKIQVMLSGYLKVQKLKADKSQELLNEFRERKEQLRREKEQILKHYESLPDFDKLPNAQQLPPLPSAGELFHK